MEDSPDPGSGVGRLLAEIKPRWTRQRHERVFAAILERIRREEGRAGKPSSASASARARARLRLDPASR